jgi:hypothetical protein
VSGFKTKVSENILTRSFDRNDQTMKKIKGNIHALRGHSTRPSEPSPVVTRHGHAKSLGTDPSADASGGRFENPAGASVASQQQAAMQNNNPRG